MASRHPAAAPSLPGFTHVRPLGTGGFADVFLFEQDLPRRPVAVKVLLEDVVDDGLLRMFNAEADAMARLSAHPSILTIYEASISADGRPYLVMEYCPSSMMARSRRETIPVAEVLQTGVKIASALETAHRAGLLHRDIKPSNVLVTTFGNPVLSDFGIAAALNSRSDVDEVFAMSVPWSAPEIVDERVSGSITAEVWGLGATLYTLLCGRSPFQKAEKAQNSREQLKTRIRRARYTPLERRDVPPSLEGVLQRAMSRDPALRQQSAAELAHDLQLIQHRLGLAPTSLEVAVDEWATADAPIDFHDDRERGPVRPALERPSLRAARHQTRGHRHPGERRRPDEGTALTGPEPRRRRNALWITLLTCATVLLAAGGTILTVVVANGGM